MQNQSGSSNPDQIDFKEYPFKKLTAEGEGVYGKIVAQSKWLPTDSGGTRRILNLVNDKEKFSWSIDSDGKKESLADAIDAGNLGDTRVGDLFKQTWVSTVVTKNNRKFRQYETKLKRGE
jgi:hypothetical protein